MAALVLVLAGAGVRFGAETGPGRALIVRLANGLRLGPVGHLRVEGLSGDVFTRFALRRLSIVDARGTWLDAHDLELAWRPLELLRRRVHARSLRAGDLVVLRRPEVERHPPGPAREGPVSIAVDDLSGRLETRPALSNVPGDWDLHGRFDYSRAGRADGRIAADSRLHAGDGVRLAFALGDNRLHLDGAAVEGRGGALAGAVGLPPDRRFTVEARADGDDAGGAFRFDARSGDAQPASAAGRWTPEGGRLDAEVRLSASRLTQWFAQRVGPTVRLQVAATRRPDGLYVVEASATGAAARATASGPVDVKARTSPGLAVDASVDRFGDWLRDVDLGPTRAQGVLVGGFDRFALKGRLSGDRFQRNGYTLAHAEGPAEVARDRGGWRWSGSLVGTGGGGAGGLLPLLGARPTLQTTGRALPDKRWLIEELHLAGANLRLDGSGGAGLLGGISFHGKLGLPSVAGVRPGSHGALDADWTADSAKGAHAWRFAVQAQGAGLATGLPEADRLLGAAPRLTARGVYADGEVDIAAADLAGAKAHATARGTYAKGGALDVGLDWTAQGPFAAGPVEVAGAMHGSGRVTGTPAAPRADLQAQLASVDLGKLVVAPAALHLTFAKDGEALAGEAALTGTTRDGPAQAHGRFRFVPHGLDLDDVLAQAGGVQLAGSLALLDGAPSRADLRVAAVPGVFLATGKLTGAVKIDARPGASPLAAVRLQGADLSLPGQATRLAALQLSADGPLDRLPLKLSLAATGPVEATFAGTGLLLQTGQGGAAGRDLALTGAGKARGMDFRTLEPARFALGPDGKAVSLRLAAAGGRVSLDGRQGADGTLRAQGQVAGVGLAAVLDDYAGALDATFHLQGQGARLAGGLDAHIADARTRDAAASLALDATLHAQLADGRLKLQAAATNRQGLKATGHVDLPAEAAADPFRIAVDRTRPLTGEIAADGELKPLWDLLAGGERTLSGRVVARGALAGTLNAPKVTGEASIAGGRFADSATGLTLEKLDAQAAVSRDRVDVRRFSGTDGHAGQLSGSGVVSLTPDGGSSFQIELAKFQLLDNELGRAVASGPVTVVRDAQGKARVVGKLRIVRAEITTKTPTPTGVVPLEVVEVNLPVRPDGVPAAAPRRAGAGLVALDVSLTAPGGVFVRGKGLDAELSLDAHVVGTTATPQLSGQARILRGSYDFSGKRFDLDPGGTVRLAAKPEDIRLDLKAERDDPALDAVVRIRGSAARPEITLTSRPVLPQDEVLSRVLFGVSASQLSPFEAAQLATALAGLATGGGFDVLANLRQFAGLDRLALGGGTGSGASITGGKYVSRNVYVELTGAAQGRSQTATTAAQQARTGPSASVEWRVRRDLSFISQAWTGGDARLSVRFRRSW